MNNRIQTTFDRINKDVKSRLDNRIRLNSYLDMIVRLTINRIIEFDQELDKINLSKSDSLELLQLLIRKQSDKIYIQQYLLSEDPKQLKQILKNRSRFSESWLRKTNRKEHYPFKNCLDIDIINQFKKNNKDHFDLMRFKVRGYEAHLFFEKKVISIDEIDWREDHRCVRTSSRKIPFNRIKEVKKVSEQ